MDVAVPWQPCLSFYIRGVHWRHLANTTEPSVCGGDAALCQITLTTCLFHHYKPNLRDAPTPISEILLLLTFVAWLILHNAGL